LHQLEERYLTSLLFARNGSRRIMRYINLILIVMTFFLFGCSKEEISINKHIPNESGTANEKKEEQNFSMGLGVFDDSSKNEDQIIFELEEEETFSPKITISSTFPNTTKYRLWFLLDYKTVPVKYNNLENSFIDITLKNEEKNLEVLLPKIENGIHDFIVLAVREPDNLLDEPKYISPTEVYLARRSTITVGEIKQNRTENIKFKHENLLRESNMEDGYSSPYLVSNNKTNFDNFLSKIENKPQMIQLLMGTNNNINNFMIFGILGNEQIDVLSPAISVKGRGDFLIDLLKLPLSKERINNNLIIGIVQDPYTIDEKELILQNVDIVNLTSITN
jgi:hypothetical protein